LADYTVQHRSHKSFTSLVCQLGMRSYHFVPCFERPPYLEGARPTFILALSQILSSFTKLLDKENMLPEWQSCKFNPAGLNISAIIDNIKTDDPEYRKRVSVYWKRVSEYEDWSENIPLPRRLIDIQKPKPKIPHWGNVLLHQMFGQDCVDVHNYTTTELNPAMAKLAVEILKKAVREIRSEIRPEASFRDPQGIHDKISGIITSIELKYYAKDAKDVNKHEELKIHNVNHRRVHAKACRSLFARVAVPSGLESVFAAQKSVFAIMWLITSQQLTTLRV